MSAPLDHVGPNYERITVPPNGEPQLVCAFWPECQCGGDCTDRRDARLIRTVLRLLTAAVLAIAAGLAVWGMQP